MDLSKVDITFMAVWGSMRPVWTRSSSVSIRDIPMLLEDRCELEMALVKMMDHTCYHGRVRSRIRFLKPCSGGRWVSVMQEWRGEIELDS